jgi:hypothetical protein
MPANHPIHSSRRIACDLSEGVGRDSTCVLVRDDWGVLACEVSSGAGLPEAAAVIAKLARQWDVRHNRIGYDKVGIGRNMPNHLYKVGIRDALPYAAAGAPADGSSFVNLRSEAAWKLRNRLDPEFHDYVPGLGMSPQRPFHFAPGPYTDRLREELRPLTYSLVGKKVKLLNKEDHTDALGHSADVFDTLAQSFAW